MGGVLGFTHWVKCGQSVGSDMTAQKRPDVVSALCLVANSRITANAEPWDYGWFSADYRRSADSSATGPDGRPVRFSSEGVSALETAVEVLLRDRQVARGWDEKELWGVVTSLVSTLPLTISQPVLVSEIQRRLSELADHRGTFVAFEVANIRPVSAPLQIAESVLGEAGSDWLNLAVKLRAERPLHAQLLSVWQSRGGPVPQATVYGTWVSTHGQRARTEAEQRFHETVALALMLEPDLAVHGLYSGRGDSHRPGLRGLVIDREALGRLSGARADLSAKILTAEPTGVRVSTHWWGNDPFPLGQLLSGADKHATVSSIVAQDTNIARRFRTAASWYARAHWSAQPEDAVLSLGVAFDALLGERNGLPGRALTDRFALLEPDCSLRAARAKRFGEMYSARSAVAHGGKSTLVEEDGFQRSMATELRQTAIRLISLTRTMSIETEDEFRDLFDGLKWGTIRG